MSTARSTARRPSWRRMWSARCGCSRRRAPIGAGSTRPAQARFRFHHVSTDEVFGALGADDPPFSRSHALRSALALLGEQGGGRSSGARLGPHLRPAGARDQLHQQLRALPFSRKAHPADDHQGAERRALPVYGRGENVRDWLHVEDHAEALVAVVERGRAGRDLFHRRRRGADEPRRGDAASPTSSTRWPSRLPRGAPRAGLITFVTDRPGHDFRYAMDISKIERELGWRPSRDFRERLARDRRVVSSRTRRGGGRSPKRYAGERLGARRRRRSPARSMTRCAVLVFGSTGQVAQALARAEWPKGRSLTSLDRQAADFRARRSSARSCETRAGHRDRRRRLHGGRHGGER